MVDLLAAGLALHVLQIVTIQIVQEGLVTEFGRDVLVRVDAEVEVLGRGILVQEVDVEEGAPGGPEEVHVQVGDEFLQIVLVGVFADSPGVIARIRQMCSERCRALYDCTPLVGQTRAAPADQQDRRTEEKVSLSHSHLVFSSLRPRGPREAVIG